MRTVDWGAPVRLVGKMVLGSVMAAGRFAMFTASLWRELIPGLRYFRLIMEQARFIGIGSLPLVILTSVFVGAVSALQAAYQFQGKLPQFLVGTLIAKSVFLELGPVLTALVVGARVGASFAAEIGTMRVTEQVDALETLAIRPVRFLAVPRVVAAFFMLPAITVFANGIAILGGMMVSMARIGMSSQTFIRGLRFLFNPDDIYGGLMKSFVFGAIIAIEGCFYGFQTTGGAEGVGVATTKAVVASCVMILVVDYFLAEVIFQIIFPA